ncbi:MAG: secondary thiamine-phosphate synthase enzyme YjbQ [Elusimicrobiota bacterium]|jgi:secondary thiamine-phosphate synthase enzyme|nr:secondary thiamine-phosphate synthase enzyme YjbQ [Elusimicrobiota bacterium]
MIYSEYLNFETKGFSDIVDITDSIKKIIERSDVKNGLATVAVPSSTSAITTLEFEPGLVADIKKALEVIVPEKSYYAHDERWHDGNGFSHIRSSLLGTSKTIPVVSGSLFLGVWQQIIFADFDNRPRSRKVFVQIIGE